MISIRANKIFNVLMSSTAQALVPRAVLTVLGKVCNAIQAMLMLLRYSLASLFMNLQHSSRPPVPKLVQVHYLLTLSAQYMQHEKYKKYD